MRKLSLIIVAVLSVFQLRAQENPHGDDLSFDCLDCHTTEGWTFTEATARFSHDLTDFVLEGQHTVADCKACHTTLVFSEAKSNCIDCHNDMHNNTVGLDCSRCHDSQSWLVSNITEIHQTSRFPLLGAHNSVDCSACHTSASLLEFQPLGVECIDCHRQDYYATTAPNHVEAGYSTDCMECHQIDAFSWAAQGINHDFFPLTKGHANTSCTQCHTSGAFEPVSTDCFSCHESDYAAATNPSHQNSGFTTQCTDCHTTEPGWSPAEFSIHDDFYFPIYSGEHRGEWNDCFDCHTQQNNYSLFSCIDCHEHNQNEMDDEHRGINGYSYNSLACFACHPLGREEGAFNHDVTGFPLKGAHIQNDCLSCHTEGFSGTSSSCNSCHISNYNEAANPSHLSAGISQECETCHDEEGWSPSLFDHTVTSGFELTGGHSDRQCVDCHLGTTTAADPACISCHQENYNSAENHLASNYPTDCLQCHSVNSWDGADFDHNLTQFPLTGSHIATECTACHTDGYAGTSTLCSSCHTENYNTAQNPSHVSAGIALDCEDCHTTTAWIPSPFDHTVTSGFELTGGHSGRQCVDCHIGTTTAADPACISCHQENYNSAENHLASNYPTDCLQCHSVNSWEGADFDHNLTQFPLTGSHIATECTACHTDGYAGTSTLCSSCHTDNYNTAQNPSHVSAGIALECEDCHTTTAWIPSPFDHTVTSGFELTGGHSGRQCVDCHIGTTTAADPACISCHQENYNSAENHLASNYPTDCLQCHSVNSWDGASFDHNLTQFPLTGAHIATECTACHTDGYAGTSMQCNSCHLTDYNNTANPNHSSLGLSVSCGDCHTTNPGWEPALFPNHNDYYALNGAHAIVANNCFLCHEGNYTSTATSCYGCHSADYNNTNDPSHAAANFPIDCESCHTESAWEPSTFDHDGQYFPIYSGEHRGEWNSCTDCHTQTSNYSVFSCIDCHEHNQTEMDSEHRDVSGYVYASLSCFECHPTGRAEDD
ncbi:hypothetical protein [uncultured Draconibacterium sp.]|uniref:hypothetical protein n=1 Tax=uncultured Draconibacterium sp. TaxID=1573823 RepID=UPI0029C601D3|nr:hypothetical protein [uncultured Draconibacterium sp.]